MQIKNNIFSTLEFKKSYLSKMSQKNNKLSSPELFFFVEYFKLRNKYLSNILTTFSFLKNGNFVDFKSMLLEKKTTILQLRHYLFNNIRVIEFSLFCFGYYGFKFDLSV